MAVLDRLKVPRGIPKHIYCGNGSEFVSGLMDLKVYASGAMLNYSRRGKSTDNTSIASFSGAFRGEFWNAHLLKSLKRAK